MPRLVLLLLLLTALPALAAEEAQPLRREDFAWGMPLTVSGRSAVCSLSLPAEVYQGCTRPDLGDLRVFNASGPVPHLLRPPQPEQQARPAQALPFFPLADPLNGADSAAAFGIAIGSGGAVIAINAGPAPQPGQAVAAYVLDASALPRPPDWLEFAWTGQGGQFSASVAIDSSGDLNRWRPLVPSAALAELRFGGHQLLRSRIELPQSAAGRYLRLSWPPGKEGVTLTAVQAGYDSEARTQPRLLLSLAGQPDPAAGQGRSAWLYDAGGFFPVDQCGIRLPEQNSLAEFAVLARADQQRPWQQITSLLAWRLKVDGLPLDSGPRRLAPISDRLWRLETEDAGSGGKAPLLELGWLPGQLLFMAQGEGPYTLAYGKAGLQPLRSQVGQLLQAVEPVSGGRLIEAAQAGPQLELGGRNMLEAQAAPFPWRVWLLWAGLIAGVLAVGAMAWRLFQEMSRQKS